MFICTHKRRAQIFSLTRHESQDNNRVTSMLQANKILSLNEAISRFGKTLDLDGDTQKAYRLDLERFLAYMSPDANLANIDKETIRGYLDNLITKEGKRVSLATQNRHYATLRRFFLWLNVEGHLENNPATNIARRKPNKDQGELPAGSIIRCLEREQVAKIIDNTRLLRDKALFSLIYSTGLRVSEALSLRLEDINLNTDTMQVRSTKGNRPRKAYLSKSLKPLLKKYIKDLPSEKGWLFPTSHAQDRPLSYGRARQLFSEAAEEIVNPDGSRVTIHQLRHTFASERAGQMDSLLLMDLMGHSDIRTTLRYAKVSGYAAKKAFDTFDQHFSLRLN